MIDTMNIITDALTEALETMAFMEIQPLEDDLHVSEELFLTEIGFVGPQNGSIRILAGREFAETLAENIAALDEVTEAERQDALKELVNVTCGLITPVMASDMSDVFDLTIPAIRDCSPDWHAFVSDEDGCVLNVEGYLIAARLTLHD
ncbi:MAG: chemotaxis protein CheX [Planctomycetes bacterium]|nr:chemotaxis protein CheX [Planctomycetota bacterium]